MKYREWNRTGKRKRMVCFTIADIAGARGVNNAAVHRAKERGAIDLDDIESVARYVLCKRNHEETKAVSPTLKTAQGPTQEELLDWAAKALSTYPK